MTPFSSYGINKIATADAFALAAHSAVGQKRKYTGERYIVHPRSVAKIVQLTSNFDWKDVCVALLHDVIEDTNVSDDDVEETFGPLIRSNVVWLTNVPVEAGNRAKRFQLNLERLTDAPVNVKTIKIADLIDNTSTIVAHDPKFAPLYLSEKKTLLEKALRNGDGMLWAYAMKLCVENLRRIESANKLSF